METLPRAWRFLQKPWIEKRRSLYGRWTSAFPRLPMPLRLPFGAWWLVRGDHAGLAISRNTFETAEIAFVDRFLAPGMTVLDIGAHHGLYTLLSSRKVGLHGHVFAFEPSFRERNALLQHLKLNRCRNVDVEHFALGAKEAVGQLYVVDGSETGCNSLMPPTMVSRTTPVATRVRRLDDWISERNLHRVDFIKLDVEGGECGVLRGASRLLQRRPRPVILAEVQDVRTEPWGYPAKEIIRQLESNGFRWFGLLQDGTPDALDLSEDRFEGNFVACPEEQVETFLRRMSSPRTNSPG